MRDLDIETEVTIGFHLMGNRFQLNLIPKSITINHVFIIKFVYVITLRCLLTLILYQQGHCGNMWPVINNVHLEHNIFLF